jgi:hypothetical protein
MFNQRTLVKLVYKVDAVFSPILIFSGKAFIRNMFSIRYCYIAYNNSAELLQYFSLNSYG